METVDPIDQLLMMLNWNDDYTDEFKRAKLIEFVKFAYLGWQKGEL